MIRKNSIEDTIKNGLIITATTTEIFFAPKKVENTKPDAINIMKLVNGLCGGVLLKDYVSF